MVNFTPISRNAIEASRCPVCPGQWPFSARYFCAADFVPFEAFGRQKLKTFLPSRGAIHAGKGPDMLIVTRLASEPGTPRSCGTKPIGHAVS